MVVEITGSVLIMVSAVAAALVAATVMYDSAAQYDEYSISNIGIEVWDRFGGGTNLTWAYITLTYPGGHLEIDGDIRLCLEARDETTNECEYTRKPEVPHCGASKHNCSEWGAAGSDIQVQYEGVMDVGFDAERGDMLGYVIYGPGHSYAGVVPVR